MAFTNGAGNAMLWLPGPSRKRARRPRAALRRGKAGSRLPLAACSGSCSASRLRGSEATFRTTQRSGARPGNETGT